MQHGEYVRLLLLGFLWTLSDKKVFLPQEQLLPAYGKHY